MKASEAKMESDVTYRGRREHYLRTVTGAVPFVLSVAAVAFCILLSVQSNDIEHRVAGLESATGELLFHPFSKISMDQFNSMVQGRVDELLAKVSISYSS